MTPGTTPPDDMEDMDPGLARERTELAWHRTAISFAALGAAVLKETPAAGILILAMSAFIFMLGRRPRRSPLLITVAVTTMSLLALTLAVVDDGSPLPW